MFRMAICLLYLLVLLVHHPKEPITIVCNLNLCSPIELKDILFRKVRERYV
jgi:hypothetical protein